jgi:hypothetical protein
MNSVGYPGVEHIGGIIERLEGISSACVHYAYRLGQPLGGGEVVGIAETMGNENSKERATRTTGFLIPFPQEGPHTSLTGDGKQTDC